MKLSLSSVQPQIYEEQVCFLLLHEGSHRVLKSNFVSLSLGLWDCKGTTAMALRSNKEASSHLDIQRLFMQEHRRE